MIGVLLGACMLALGYHTKGITVDVVCASMGCVFAWYMLTHDPEALPRPEKLMDEWPC